MRKFTLLTGLLLLICFAGNLFAQGSSNTFSYASPKPGAIYANLEHTITLRHGDPIDLKSVDASLFEINGTISGIHDGEVILASDERTLIYKPFEPFAYNEQITVSVDAGITTKTGLEIAPYSYTFRTKKQDNTILRKKFVQWMTEQNRKYFEENFSSLPAGSNQQRVKSSLPDDLPVMDVQVINNPAPGYIFYNPHNVLHPLNLPAYSVIMDHYGTPVYYKKFPVHTLDFKIQETGHPSQFFASDSPGLGIGYGHFVTYDSWMNPVDTFQMGNGYMAEMHDFQLFNDGSYLLFTYDPQIVDMSEIVEGGDPAATVMGFVLQELDADGNVVFEWSAWDDIQITDATPDIDLTGVFIDYCHGNAVEKDIDGNFMVSFRNTDEIIKINRETGELMWRMNAFHDELNDITFINDTIKFSHQHDIRRQDNGNITIFDNGNLHYGPYSRILEYELDEVNKTAELVYVYPPEPGMGHHFAFATGGAHRQPNGNTTVGWGITFPFKSYAKIIGEVNPDAEAVYEVYADDTITTYRAHKHQWETDMFTLSKDTIDWGQFSGYTPEPYILQVTNNAENAITISGTHNHRQEFYPTTAFPIVVEPAATSNITINFFPSLEGYFEDILTVMVAKGENEMIAKQVILMGNTNDVTAPAIEFDPEHETDDVIRMPKLMITFKEKLYKNGEPLTNDDLQEIMLLNKDQAGGEEVPFKARIKWYDNNKTEIMITPFDYLDAYTTYAWGIKANMVQDWAGNGYSTDEVALFTTGEAMGVDDLVVNDFARAFPNPTSGIVNIEFLNNNEKSIRVFDINGSEIMKIDKVRTYSSKLNLGNQNGGIYIIQVVDKKNNATSVLKVIRE